jgi:hypothetical protein
VRVDRSGALRTASAAVIALVVFTAAWLYRFNDPGGQFAGLTDDHFFYVVRGWQILFGDLPVRDFVDHGAPLHFYLAAAVQTVFGRGTLSEVAFSVTALAASAALVFLWAARASGSLAAAAGGVLVHILLGPRFYNYPKILVYALAIPLLWRFADRRDAWTRRALAIVAAIGFLLRHDHGAFVAAAFAATLVLARDVPWRERLRHAMAFVGVAAALVLPYLLFVQMNGGLAQYFQDAISWTTRERSRAPFVWPGLFDNPDGASAAQQSGSLFWRPAAIVQDNLVAWVFYLEVLLPVLVLGLLAVTRDALRPGWPHGVNKIATVAVLAIVLNAGFLRSPLAARLADPSVPHAILLAWLLSAAVRLLGDAERIREGARRWALALRAGTAAVTVLAALVLAAGLGPLLVGGLVRTRFIERSRVGAGEMMFRPGHAIERAFDVSRQLARGWELPQRRLAFRQPTDLTALAHYLHVCTAPTDRVLVQSYIPQVLALAERAFAGGHADLRPGFFTNEAAQRLTVARLARQPVPIVLLEAGDAQRNFRESFPIVSAYLDERYETRGERPFDALRLVLLAERSRSASGEFAPLGWPCFVPHATLSGP